MHKHNQGIPARNDRSKLSLEPYDAQACFELPSQRSSIVNIQVMFKCIAFTLASFVYVHHLSINDHQSLRRKENKSILFHGDTSRYDVNCSSIGKNLMLPSSPNSIYTNAVEIVVAYYKSTMEWMFNDIINQILIGTKVGVAIMSICGEES